MVVKDSNKGQGGAIGTEAGDEKLMRNGREESVAKAIEKVGYDEYWSMITWS